MNELEILDHEILDFLAYRYGLDATNPDRSLDLSDHRSAADHHTD
jgi:hypothetical protein